MRIQHLILNPLLLSSLWISPSAHGQSSYRAEQPAACRGEADYVFPSITLVPTTDVVVGESDEFQSESIDDVLVFKHIGEAKRIRFPSIVAIGKHVVLNLKAEGTEYCFVSTVALLGGSIKVKGVKGTIGTISAVGDVRIGE
jgi:hypothetical protein